MFMLSSQNTLFQGKDIDLFILLTSLDCFKLEQVLTNGALDLQKQSSPSNFGDLRSLVFLALCWNINIVNIAFRFTTASIEKLSGQNRSAPAVKLLF